MKRENPDFVPPTSHHAKETISRLGNTSLATNGQKRQAPDRTAEDERESKREKTNESDDEEMEIEDDEDDTAKSSGSCYIPSTLAAGERSTLISNC